jgi:metal-responsive CopG/Arc/MetJ family transcriptional regulator
VRYRLQAASCKLHLLRIQFLPKVYTFTKKHALKNLSLKLEDDIFRETEKIVSKVKKSRNRYINDAIALYNQLYKRRLLSKQLCAESRAVAKDSLEVLAEFEKLNRED